jgi:hypothetical protein
MIAPLLDCPDAPVSNHLRLARSSQFLRSVACVTAKNIALPEPRGARSDGRVGEIYPLSTHCTGNGYLETASGTVDCHDHG